MAGSHYFHGAADKRALLLRRLAVIDQQGEGDRTRRELTIHGTLPPCQATNTVADVQAMETQAAGLREQLGSLQQQEGS